ncbi:MAG: hypothetical protein AAFR22_21265, partial [Chloroflexota bacterium]
MKFIRTLPLKHLLVIAAVLLAIVTGTATQANAQTDTATAFLQVAPGTIAVNSTFDVQMHCQDASNNPVFSCFANLGFPNDLVSVVSIAYSNEYPNYQQGSIQTSSVRNLGAVATVTQPNNTRVATVTFRVIQAGLANFTLQQNNGDFSEVTVYGLDNDQRPTTAFNNLQVTLGTPQIVVSPSSAQTIVEDGSVQFTFTLATPPTAPVTQPLNTSSGECEITGPPVVLNAQNYNTGVTITVSGVDDTVVDGDQACNLFTLNPTSSDPNYDALGAGDVPNVLITVTDNDTAPAPAAIDITPTSRQTVAEGSSVQFTVTLASSPSAPVTLPLGTSSNQCTLSTPSVMLNATNFQTGVTFTVDATEETVVDGTQPCNLFTNNPSSGDPAYNALGAADVPNVFIDVTDNDTNGVASAPEVSEPEAVP